MRIKYIVIGSVVYLAGGIVAQKYLKSEVAAREKFPTKDERKAVMNQIATVYDSDIVTQRTEWLIGIQKLRKKMIGQARGKVLEVAGGTGKNFVHYTHDVDSLVILDSSDMMIQTAIWKFRSLNKGKKQMNLKADTDVQFLVKDAENLIGIPDSSMDTVIDSFGLCSFNDPVQAVKEMGRVCKEDGRILLLEHGRSSFHTWLNKLMLDEYAISHAWKYGCTWNRDIPAIVQEAGLEIISEKRSYFGTNITIVARPKRTEKE